MFYIFLADGFEETEALVPYDLLTRAGIECALVGVGTEVIKGTHGIKITSDISADNIDLSLCEGIMLPGGMPGTNNLLNCVTVLNAVKYAYDNNKAVCAICAAPMILGKMNMLNGVNCVCFPGFEKYLTGAVLSDKSAVTDKNIITAKGAGAVFEFSYEIIKYLKNEDTAAQVLETVQCRLI